MINFEITSEQVRRVERDWKGYAKENVSVEVVSGVLYGFCSELAALRIASKYPKQIFEGTAKAAFSTNLNSWFFRLEV